MDLIAVLAIGVAMIPVALLTAGAFRIVLAVAFLAFLPGYALTSALFPRKGSIDLLQRFALSLLLNVVLVSIAGVALACTPWGLTPGSTIATVSGLTIAGSLLALWRRSAVPSTERFTRGVHIRPPSLPKSRLDTILAGILALAILGAAASLAYVIAVPRNVQHYTEFYLLGAEGTMEHYPREAVLGRSENMTVAIVNHEGDYMDYSVAVTIDGAQSGRTDSIRLAEGRTWQSAVSVTPSKTGRDQRVDFLLYRSDRPDPYLTLHLILDVGASP